MRGGNLYNDATTEEETEDEGREGEKVEGDMSLPSFLLSFHFYKKLYILNVPFFLS